VEVKNLVVNNDFNDFYQMFFSLRMDIKGECENFLKDDLRERASILEIALANQIDALILQEFGHFCLLNTVDACCVHH